MKIPAEWEAEDGPEGDFLYAMGDALGVRTYTADVIKAERENISLADIKEIHEYSVSYHGTKWPGEPEYGGGSELDMQVLMELNDGNWAYLCAWNDYTGWGCQDGVDIYVGTREEIIENCMTKGEREELGL